MKQSTAANCALCLAILCWPLIIFGMMSQLGDYSSTTPNEVIAANRRISLTVVSVGLSCFLGSMWLSGYGFTGAKIRSALAAAISTGLILLGIFSMWH